MCLANMNIVQIFVELILNLHQQYKLTIKLVRLHASPPLMKTAYLMIKLISGMKYHLFHPRKRHAMAHRYKNVEQHIIKDVTKLLCRISEKADRFTNNSTTNLAESWMHIQTQFDGGKVHNLCNRGSWHARCYGEELRMNMGPQWSCKVCESSSGT